MNKKLAEKLRHVPRDPGCYQYYDAAGKLLYVGKAKSLKKRVSSYFQKKDHDPKTQVLVSLIHDVKWIVTGSEMEALILEAQLIKRYLPRYNIKIKDDKSFLYVKLDFHAPYPRPVLVRTVTKPVADSKLKIYGPYTDASTLKAGLQVLRKIFRWCELSEAEIGRRLKNGRPCFDTHIDYCRGVCAGRITQAEYLQDMRQLALFFEGKKERLLRDLKKEMQHLAKKKDFEKAALLRDRVEALEHIGKAESIKRKTHNGSGKGGAIEDQSTMSNQQQVLENIIAAINRAFHYQITPSDQFRIELYDMSNIQGAEPVGSMVVWQDGAMMPREYKRFKIKTVKGVNDFAMMKEVLSRRLKRLERSAASVQRLGGTKKGAQLPVTRSTLSAGHMWRTPDLIILDGGKPQLSTIWQLFEKEGIRIPLVGLAKREEEVWGIDTKKLAFAKANIAKNSPEGYFIQRIRDEAHRFAITYHKKLRRERNITSRLDDIHGIGPVTKKKLMKEFGSFDQIQAASLDQLRPILGKRTEMIKEQLGS